MTVKAAWAKVKHLPIGSVVAWIVLVGLTILSRNVVARGPAMTWQELIGIAAFWALAVIAAKAALDYVRHPRAASATVKHKKVKKPHR